MNCWICSSVKGAKHAASEKMFGLGGTFHYWECADLAEERLALMDKSGLDVQVLSLTTPALHDLGPQAVDMAQRINDALVNALARQPASPR